MFQVARLNVPNNLLNIHSITTRKTKECKGNQKTVFGVVLHLNWTVVLKIIKSNKDITHDCNKFYQRVTYILSAFCFVNRSFMTLGEDF